MLNSIRQIFAPKLTAEEAEVIDTAIQFLASEDCCEDEQRILKALLERVGNA